MEHLMRKIIGLALSGILLAACGSPAEKTVDDGTPVTLAEDDVMAKYIPWNGDAENVQTTESGLQYIVVKEGPEGGAVPTSRDRVSVMYDGRLTDGTVFDSSYARGSTSTFGVSQVIRGWTEGLQLMSEGDEFIFYIPTEIGYGQNPRPGGAIKPGDDLIFRVELKQVAKAPEPKAVDADAWAKFTPWNSELPEVQKTGSGLEYVILASGDEAGVSPTNSEMVVLYYEGRFDDGGEVFDSAFQRGEPILSEANRFIPGWVEILRRMKPDDRWLVHVPSGLAYGKRGSPPVIPADAALNFEIELMDVVPVQ
jgi:FKBP-type peptidyl-prolyl cis-trans isomerase